MLRWYVEWRDDGFDWTGEYVEADTAQAALAQMSERLEGTECSPEYVRAVGGTVSCHRCGEQADALNHRLLCKACVAAIVRADLPTAEAA